MVHQGYQNLRGIKFTDWPSGLRQTTCSCYGLKPVASSNLASVSMEKWPSGLRQRLAKSP